MASENRASPTGHGQLLGKSVRRRREALGFTQEELAELVGGEVDANYITHLETGRRVRLPEQPLFGQIASALRVSQIELLVDAGMITEPLPTPGAVREPFPRQSPHAKVIQYLHELDDASALEVARFCLFQIEHPVVDVPVMVGALER